MGRWISLSSFQSHSRWVHFFSGQIGEHFDVDDVVSAPFTLPNTNYTILVEGYTPLNTFEFVKAVPEQFNFREF